MINGNLAAVSSVQSADQSSSMDPTNDCRWKGVTLQSRLSVLEEPLIP